MYEARSDQQILHEIGDRLRKARLLCNLTQQQLADNSGLSLKTIQNMEGGGNASLESLTRCLRSLGHLSDLDSLLPDMGISPMELVRNQGKTRQRASGSRLREPNLGEQGWEWKE